jgi:type II secretory pathway component PulF
MAVSDFFTNSWFLMLVGTISFVIGIKIWKQTKSGKYKFDLFLIKMPLFGPIMKKVVLSKFARVFSDLLGS